MTASGLLDRSSLDDLKGNLDAFRDQVEEAVIMSNVLAQELASMHRDLETQMPEAERPAAGGQASELAGALAKLKSTADQIADFTGRLERDIDTFLTETERQLKGAA